MPPSSIQLPTDFSANMLGVSNNMFTSFSPLIYTVCGILLALVAIEILVGIFRK